MNIRLREILLKNAESEKESPYNFCDRWCERCVHEKQVRCSLYKDDLERRLVCIAHGRDEDDAEITKAVMEAQYEGVEEKMDEQPVKFGIDLDGLGIGEIEPDEDDAIEMGDLPPDIQEHIRFVESNPLDAAAKEYSKRAHEFLQETLYAKNRVSAEHRYDLETLSWHHTLLPAKIRRALCGFHEPVSEGDISLYDAVAQFQICKKVVAESVDALRRQETLYPSFKTRIQAMLALLHNINSRIGKMEEGIV